HLRRHPRDTNRSYCLSRRPSDRVAKMIVHHLRDVPRIQATAIDKGRTAATLKGLTDDVEARRARDAAALDDLAVPIDDRDIQPIVTATIAGGPNNRFDVFPAKIDDRCMSALQEGPYLVDLGWRCRLAAVIDEAVDALKRRHHAHVRLHRRFLEI